MPHRVIFQSRVARKLRAPDLLVLHNLCRRENTELGVTGVMVYHDGLFFQVLEGDEDVLVQMVQRIMNDPRVVGAQVLDHGPIEDRAFPTWRMCYAIPDGLTERPPAALCLRELMSPSSDHRGHDPKVRDHVRRFLASLQNLPQAAAG